MVLGAIHITSKPLDFGKDDIRVEWDTSETRVGILIKNELWAAFDAQGTKYGGDYSQGAQPNIPEPIERSFRTE
jgi:hypothetical protein